ncbi:putative undecaprenyl-diphosphatase YbjG [compost metagenome]
MTNMGSFKSTVSITVIVILVLYKFLNLRRELILLTYVVISTILLNHLLKSLFQRERPTIHRIIEVSGYSYPSGHSMAAFSLYGVLAFLIWRHLHTRFSRGLMIVIASLIILAIGISRIYLGVHYPTDIIGGYLMSVCWLTALIWIYQRF